MRDFNISRKTKYFFSIKTYVVEPLCDQTNFGSSGTLVRLSPCLTQEFAEKKITKNAVNITLKNALRIWKK